ncbi:ATP-dependent nuclease subunit B [Campylobacter insulaenigrae]|uniref:ATP-dependent nuclease subunit B n=2 Tax=Campylobacter insulaenigrae TaxID=260714 RepID=UPI00215352DB|nr:ATP-dependent nuclease subunit B [Campylobacter insulaenigrae]MCR6591361.1 ATP-dependent nuclease subunit B [Campylobacter insulaenigrae]MCR6592743.1 ATP-dependent nuclease subunit B [Campylobacter insulaenigrae]
MCRSLLSLILITFFYTHSFAKNEQEITQALIYEDHSEYKNACDIYTQLFEDSNESIYLQKALFLALSHNLQQKEKLLETSKDFLNLTPIIRLHAIYAFEQGNYQKAEEYTFKLIQEEQNYKNYELLGDIYAKKGLFTKAIEAYNQAYEIFAYENLLLKIIELNIRTKNINQAKENLEKFKKNYGCSLNTCTLLLKIYQDQNNTQASMQILYELYKISNDTRYIYTIIDLLNKEKKYTQALDIAQEYNLNTDIKVYLYTQIKDYSKAYNLALKQYELEKNKKYLAMAAILEFENYMDKKNQKILDKKRLESILKKFEESVDIRSDSLYQNFYGYTLIEYDIDVKKGIELVGWALEQEPNNAYYLDSLAWGYYKLKECDKAYDILQTILQDKDFVNSDEGKEHIKAIKKCLNK